MAARSARSEPDSSATDFASGFTPTKGVSHGVDYLDR